MTRLLLAVAATLLLVGCGAAENDPNLAEAIEQTESLGTGRFELKGSVDDSGVQISIVCSGSAEYGRHRVAVRCTYGDVRELEAIAIGRDFYLRAPAALGGKWVKDTGEVDEDTSLANLSPDHIFSLLRTASSETERIGDEEVRGEASTRYRLTVDCEAAELNCDGSAPVDVWIADDGTVRRIAFKDDDGEGAFEFFDFGADVAIEPPPPDQISEVGDILTPGSCEAGEAEPISVSSAVAALREHGFSVERDQHVCTQAYDTVFVTNTSSSSVEHVRATMEREGSLSCTVTRMKPEGEGKKVVEARHAGASAELKLQNLQCALFAEGPSEAQHVARLKAAFADLR